MTHPLQLSGTSCTAKIARSGVVVPILVVDDNAGKRLALTAVLAPLGHHIVEADSGLAALRCVTERDFAVILLDIRMPDMDGFETATYIRQRHQSEMTPIIFITSHGPDEIDLTERYVEGAVDFMFTPVPPAELRAKVSVFANLFIQAERLARTALDVQSSADQLRTLTDAAPIGIFQTNADGSYSYTNAQWSEITGISKADAFGQPWNIILRADDRQALIDDADGGVVGPADLHQRYDIGHPTAGMRIVVVTARSIPVDHGGTSGWVGTVADVTAEAGAELVMANARDAALAATLMQQHFAASASHELKTPTTSILGFVEEVLESDQLCDEDRGFLDIVYRNAQRLSRLIDDLLIVGQTESGALMMSLEPTPVVPLLQRALSSIAAEMERSGIIVVTDYGNSEMSALIDPLRAEQALMNLLSNAMKFTPHGGQVSVVACECLSMIEVSVTDTGPGIDPSDLPNIFDRFYRSKAAVDASVKGTGLGLAIAKGMVEAQDGTLRVISGLGRGTTFTMSLPNAHSSLPEITPELQAQE